MHKPGIPGHRRLLSNHQKQAQNVNILKTAIFLLTKPKNRSYTAVNGSV
jgi:hypothetical protein